MIANCRRGYSCVWLLACVLIVGSAHAAPISAERIVGEDAAKYKEVDEAVAKFAAGSVDEARTMLQQAAARYPDLPPAGIMMARLFLANNQELPGRIELERVVLAQPDDPEAYELLGTLALGARRITEADLLYQKVADSLQKMTGDSARKQALIKRLYAGQATVAEGRGQWEQAREHLEKWVQLDDKDARPHVRLGQSLFRLDRPEEAYEEFAKAAKLAPEMQVPEVMMARISEQAGKKDKVAQWMKLAIERNPDSPGAHVGVAEWYWRDGNLDEAKRYADKALQLAPELVDAKLIRGLVARHQKDLAEAEKQFEAIHQEAPQNFAAANQLALTWADQRDPEKLNRALQLAQQNARQHQQEPDGLATLGLILMRSGRPEDAERLLRQVATTNAMSSDAAYYLSQLMVRKNQTDEAKRLLRIALSATGPFFNRTEAQALLDQLSKKP